jgi:hypothetical protein
MWNQFYSIFLCNFQGRIKKTIAEKKYIDEGVYAEVIDLTLFDDDSDDEVEFAEDDLDDEDDHSDDENDMLED